MICQTSSARKCSTTQVCITYNIGFQNIDFMLWCRRFFCSGGNFENHLRHLSTKSKSGANEDKSYIVQICLAGVVGIGRYHFQISAVNTTRIGIFHCLPTLGWQSTLQSTVQASVPLHGVAFYVLLQVMIDAKSTEWDPGNEQLHWSDPMDGSHVWAVPQKWDKCILRQAGAVCSKVDVPSPSSNIVLLRKKLATLFCGLLC